MAVEALTCRELVELVTEYLEDTLPAAERVRFEEHLAGCRGCRNYLDQMRRTIQLSGRLTEESVPEEGREKLLEVFRNWKKS
jgi:predicted anti-sigma-YlaC factor YlaD